MREQESGAAHGCGNEPLRSRLMRRSTRWKTTPTCRAHRFMPRQLFFFFFSFFKGNQEIGSASRDRDELVVGRDRVARTRSRALTRSSTRNRALRPSGASRS